jgi:hypothetical protein
MAEALMLFGSTLEAAKNVREPLRSNDAHADASAAQSLRVDPAAKSRLSEG